MNRGINMVLRVLIPLILVVASVPVFGAPREEKGFTGFAESEIRNTMREHKIPGVAFVLVDDQERAASAAFGFADLESKTPARTDTIFKLWSVSKAFTAIEIIRLADEGIVRFDDPVNRHIPDFSVKSRFRDGSQITIRHILTHRSGLPRNDALAEPEDTLICEALEDKVSSLRHAYLAYPVGRRYHYSNTGFDLLGRIIEQKRVTCFPWYMKSVLLEPMGMPTATFFSKDLPAESVTALGYEYHRRKYQPLLQYDVAATPSSNLYASIDDLSAFLTFLFRAVDGKEELLSSAAVETMFAGQPSNPDDPQSMGLGWKRATLESGDTLVYHDGGPSEGVGALVAVIPEKKIGIALAGNSTSFGSQVMVPLAVDIIDRYLEVSGKARVTGGGASGGSAGAASRPDPAVDGRYIAFGRPAIVRKGGRKLRIEGVNLDILPAADGEYRLDHWLNRIGLGWVIPLPVDLELVGVSFPDEDSLLFRLGNLAYEYCRRYPEPVSFPVPAGDLVGEYRMVSRLPDGGIGEEPIGSAAISIDDGVLSVSGAIGPVIAIDDTTIIVMSGPFAGETMKLDPDSGVITHQHVCYLPRRY